MRLLKLSSLILILMLTACKPDGASDDSMNGLEDQTGVSENASTGIGEVSGEAQTSTGSGMENQAQGVCYNPYFPIREDDVWTYQITSSDGSVEIYTFAYDITGPDAFVVNMQFADLATSVEWVCSEEGLVRTNYAEFLSGFGEVDLSDISFTGVSFPLPDQMVVGAVWQNSFSASGTMATEMGATDFSMTFVMDNVVEGVETVEVPAGTFEAFRVATTYNMNNTMVIGGVSTPITFQFVSTTWYAEGVGMVKSTTALTEGTSVTELLSME